MPLITGMRGTLALATLRRTPARTVLAILGIAVAAALLLDMVMLATGMRESFRSLLLTRGYQLRVSPKGTLPFDSEATIDGAGAIIAALRANSDITAVSPSLGTTLAMPGSTLPSVFTLGLEPDVQGDYALDRGDDLPLPQQVTPNDQPLAAVVNRSFLMRTGRRLGDTLTVSAGLDAQLRTAARSRRLQLRGEARFFYVPEETPVLALPLAEVRRLLGPAYRDRMSLAMAGLGGPSHA